MLQVLFPQSMGDQSVYISNPPYLGVYLPIGFNGVIPDYKVELEPGAYSCL